MEPLMVSPHLTMPEGLHVGHAELSHHNLVTKYIDVFLLL